MYYGVDKVIFESIYTLPSLRLKTPQARIPRRSRLLRRPVQNLSLHPNPNQSILRIQLHPHTGRRGEKYTRGLRTVTYLLYSFQHLQCAIASRIYKLFDRRSKAVILQASPEIMAQRANPLHKHIGLKQQHG